MQQRHSFTAQQHRQMQGNVTGVVSFGGMTLLFVPCLPCAAPQTYKAEVLAFLEALPTAALAQLLRLPEPASLPRRSPAGQAQQCRTGKAGGSSGTSSAEAAAAAAAIERLQGSKLTDAWLNASLAAAAASSDEGPAAALCLSELAQLCCGVDPEDEQRIPLLRPGSSSIAATKYEEAEQQQQEGKCENTTAAALAAAHVAALRGACCSSCSEVTGSKALPAASSLMSCNCCCHPASSDAAQQQGAPLPALHHIVSLLERASEGTWLCNPRLLQQPHPANCSCSMCLGLVGAGAGPAGSWSPEAVMASISGGLDVLDVLGEWGVNDAALSYAVERRLVTAFHKVSAATP